MSHGQARATYLHAGVDEQREQKTLREIMLPWFEKTRLSSVAHSVLGVGAGHFATVVKFAAGNSIALSTDGVGTKILVARMADRYEPIGVDCVANNVNDLICIGARPLILLDYIAIDRIDENVLERIARGLSEGAQEAQVEIAGGEIAQVAVLLASSEDGPPMFDLVGTALGEIEGNPPRTLDGSMVRLGDVVIGLPSSGLHSNGYSLACGARIHDRGGDLLLLAAAWDCHAAIWYSCVSPPRTCLRRIRRSARLISGGRVPAWAGASCPRARCGRAAL